jgi:hypothetical protein
MSRDKNTDSLNLKKFLLLGLVVTIGTYTENLFFLNEEVVVALCFLAFMAFSFQFLGNSLGKALDNRKDYFIILLKTAISTERKYCLYFFFCVSRLNKVSPSLTSCLSLILLKKQWYSYLRNKYKRLSFYHSLTKMATNRIGKKVQESKSLKTGFKDQWLNSTANRSQAATLLQCQA